jgi:hypothetical protein
MKLARVATIAATLLLLLLAACSSSKPPAATSEQKPAKPAPLPAETDSAREAFQRLYVAARGWAPDARPFRLESQTTSDANGQGGKAAVWRAFFASPSRRSMKPYVWSGSGAEGAAARGVMPGPEDTFNPANTSTQTFDIAYLKIDSDKAFSTAQAHGGEKLLKTNPAQPVTYMLDWDPRHNELIWHVIYGSGRIDSKLTVDVNASTGAYIRVEK